MHATVHTAPSSAGVLSLPSLVDDLEPLQLAYLSYLGDYHGATLINYRYHLDRYLRWCATHGLDALAVKRVHLELYVRHLLEEQGLKPSSVNSSMTPVKGFYDAAVGDEVIDRDPTRRLKLPKFSYEKSALVPFRDLMLFLEVAKSISARHWALTQLLSGMGLRISEAASLRIEDYQTVEQGQHMLRFVQKGGATAVVPVPLPVLHALDAARAGRTSGPLIATRAGGPLTRGGATGLVETVNRRAAAQGLKRHINPHLLRKSAVTEALEMGMSIRDAQTFARHADPRTTSKHYDLGRANHYRHPGHQIAARLAV